ncbi:MAG TPA: hypothetical protein VN911_02435 [Candidatus Acidoferrum sp.]|nr:hypothetical protein [Candidatus Acidoferrum sp.]
MLRRLLICAAIGLTAVVGRAQDLRVPASVTAGDEATISTSGSGKATFYLLGPGVSRRSDVNLGEEIRIQGQDLRNAGDYLALVCSDSCHSGTFYVVAAKPAKLTFLVHPSRVPVGLSDAVSGVAFPFDQFNNLVLTPKTISFQLAAGDKPLFSRAVATQNGVAWFRTASGKSAGLLQVNASLDDLSAKRAVQQVASDPCNLRITGQRIPIGIVVQTEPVHDCAGNVVPDGTIVTFSATEANGKSTVDAPVKQGVARAQIEASGATVVSVASGVVMGNELRIGAKP